MFKSRLEQRLESGDPKCANCRHWRQKGADMGDEDRPQLERLPFGLCHRFERVVQVTTTDLTVCSKWEQRE